VIGLVLAAGAGRRLRPHTTSIPKTLLSVSDDTTVLDVILGNLRAAGCRQVVLVVGYAAQAITTRAPALEARHDVRLEFIHNDHAEDRNNCYSLWCAREVLDDDVLLVNGDTVHPAAVEQRLTAGRHDGAVLLAMDDVKPLGAEEMKVVLGPDGHLLRISKELDPASVDGEYIGVCSLRSAGSAGLVDALRETWERDDSLYYEDGFQTFVDAGGVVTACSIGEVEWVEIDDEVDLRRARELVCHY
jgi:choline kinase